MNTDVNCLSDPIQYNFVQHDSNLSGTVSDRKKELIEISLRDVRHWNYFDKKDC